MILQFINNIQQIAVDFPVGRQNLKTGIKIIPSFEIGHLSASVLQDNSPRSNIPRSQISFDTCIVTSGSYIHISAAAAPGRRNAPTFPYKRSTR